jgi:hypothetical protein
MRSVAQLMQRLNLDEQSLRELLDHGKLDGQCVDQRCLDLVRAFYLAELRASRKPKH